MAELAERGLKVDYRSVWTFVHDEKLSFKKKRGGWRAFYIGLNVEHFAFLAGIGSDPFGRAAARQTQRNFAWRDYGLRVGIWPVFKMLDELQLPATILLNSLVCEHYPEVIERIKQRGDDICAHGRTNSETLAGLWEHDEARIIQETTETLTRHFVTAAKGSDTRAVLVNGRIVYRDGVFAHLFNPKRVIREAEEISRAIIDKAGLSHRLEPAWRTRETALL